MKIDQNWEFNTLGIYNFNRDGPYKKFFNYIKKNHKKIKGDIVEAGVFRGSTLLALALFLKRIKSRKKIYGFDTFDGFPKMNTRNDNIKLFKTLRKKNLIKKSHFDNVKKLIFIKRKILGKKLNFQNISSSKNFSQSNLNLLKRKIKYLKLDNIKIIKGNFKKKMMLNSKPKKIMAAFIDCDLYESYMQSLNFVWNRLEPKGIIQVDEYYSLKFPGARIACDKFFKGKNFNKKKYFSKDDDFERWFIIKN